jgi:hypothetical protein
MEREALKPGWSNRCPRRGNEHAGDEGAITAEKRDIARDVMQLPIPRPVRLR